MITGQVVTPIGNVERAYNSALKSAPVETYTALEMKTLLDARPNPRVKVDIRAFPDQRQTRRYLEITWEHSDLKGDQRFGTALVKTMQGGRIRFQDKWLPGVVDGMPALLPSIEILGADFLEEPPPFLGFVLADAFGRESIPISGADVRVNLDTDDPKLAFVRQFFGTPNACASEQELQDAMMLALNRLFFATPD